MFKTKVESPVYVKVTKDSNDVYLILVGYKVPELMTVSTNNYASIDLGINNLATVTFTNAKPIIIKTRFGDLNFSKNFDVPFFSKGSPWYRTNSRLQPRLRWCRGFSPNRS